MLFSESYKLGDVEEEDWFDLSLKWDTELFIDPILVFRTDLKEFKVCKKKIKEFFDEAFKRVALAKGNSNISLRKNALEILKFKETSEIYLGYTNFGSFGSGIGSNFAIKIFHAMIDFIDWGLEEFAEYLSPFELFAEGVGPDRMSDMVSNIIKEDLIKYTQRICKDKKIPTKKFLIANSSFDKKLGWVHQKVYLPKNILNGRPIILVPKDFLRAITDRREDFIDYVLHMENEDLRRQASTIITENIDKNKLRKVVGQNKDFFKELLKEYIQEMEKESEHYDFPNDPNLLWKFKEILDKLKSNLPNYKIKDNSKESLIDFVGRIISEFKRCVENNEGYYLLFNDNEKPRAERASQTFFWSIANTICKESKGPDISPESKTGRGFIDFKFSNGYTEKIHVEIKLAKNPKLYSGLEKQLPTYLKAEDVEKGFYVVIKQLGGDNVRVIRLQDRYKKMKKEDKDKIEIKVIDAYLETKKSASKL